MSDGNRKFSIGLFLNKHPYGGGAFQYSMSVLDAFANLPGDRYRRVVAYSEVHWEKWIKLYDMDAVYVPNSFLSIATEHIWRKLGLPIGGLRAMASRLNPASRRLIAMGCDLWIYPDQNPMSYLLPVRSLTTVHDLMHRYEPNFPEVSSYRMAEIHYRAACRWASGVMVDSKIGKEQLVESYCIDSRLVHVLPYVAPAYIYEAVESKELDRRYNLPHKFYFYPAQFWKHKNHCSLLRAVHMLRGAHPDINLVFCGSKKNGMEEIVELARDLSIDDRVRIIGYIPNEDIAGIYRRARALIMPTHFGPTNIPPLEAMAAGCPIAVSRIYAMPEQCGDAALYFDPSAVDEIADVMARLWRDDALCEALAARGRLQVQNYSQESFNQKFAAIVDGLFENHTSMT